MRSRSYLYRFVTLLTLNAVLLAYCSYPGRVRAQEPAPAQPAGQSEESVVVIAAGDIARCNLEWDSYTGALLDNLPGTILGLGDNAQFIGTLQEFNECYGPTWGRHKDRVYPVPGNHEYLTGGAEGYFTYFGDRATPLEPGCRKECKGYYSFDLGAWHIVALNSEIDNNPGSEQDLWLRADLAAHPNVCTLAYWHKPRWSSGRHGSGASAPMFQAVYDYGVDVVLSGHDHDYERFAPQSPQGVLEWERGVRQYVVGTGGDTHRGWESSAPNSEVKDAETWGVLKLTLNPTSYDWEFIPIAGQTFTDKGSANCVTAGSVPPAPAAGTVAVSTNTAPVEIAADAEATAAPALPADGLDYVVQAGDTLSLISLGYGLDWTMVAQVNGITNTDVIEIGQVIRLPGVAETTGAAATTATTVTTGTTGTTAKTGTAGVTTLRTTTPADSTSQPGTHTVAENDTIITIALQYSRDWQEVLELNGLQPDSLLQIGQQIRLR